MKTAKALINTTKKISQMSEIQFFVCSSTLVLQTRFKGQIEMRGLGKKDCQKAEQIINEGRYRFNQFNNNNNPGLSQHKIRKDFGGDRNEVR